MYLCLAEWQCMINDGQVEEKPAGTQNNSRLASSLITAPNSRARICKLSRSPRIDSKEPIPLGCVLAGRYNNPIPTRFLAPIDCLKIPALIREDTSSNPLCVVRLVVLTEGWKTLGEGIVRSFELVGETRIVRSTVINWKPGKFYFKYCWCSLTRGMALFNQSDLLTFLSTGKSISKFLSVPAYNKPESLVPER